jgi:hypothetical protein
MHMDEDNYKGKDDNSKNFKKIKLRRKKKIEVKTKKMKGKQCHVTVHKHSSSLNQSTVPKTTNTSIQLTADTPSA